jgi:sugar phosphate isomerase/epimerase
LAGAAALGGWSSVRAADPIARTGKPKFKFSLAAYSYRKFLSGQQPEMTLDDFIADCAAMQLDGTELTSYYFPPQPSPQYLRHLKSLCFRLGLDITGTAVGNDFCYPDGPQRREQIDLVKRWIDHAEVLGAPVIRIFSGRPRGEQSEAEATKLAIAAMEECCQYAGQHGVFLALENHGGLTTRIDDLLKLVQAVRSPWMGINLDTGNFHACRTAEEAYADMARMAPYALNVQVKVMIALENRGKVATDFRRLAGILRDSGYRGYIVLEYEEAEDPRAACPRHIEQLREAFA